MSIHSATGYGGISKSATWGGSGSMGMTTEDDVTV
jgi:hypothetical protein